MVSEDNGAWGNGGITDAPGRPHDPWWDINPNLVTISIEHVQPDSENATGLTPAQAASSFKLVHDICRRHTIPMRAADASGGITGHFSMDPLNRARCPGNYPWNDLWNALKERTIVLDVSQSAVAAYYKQTGPMTWECKQNGHVVRDGILTFYQHYAGVGLGALTDLGLPLENEHPSGKPGTAEQAFERGIVVYDADYVLDKPVGISGPCYLKHIDALYHLPAQMAQALAHIADIQRQLDITNAANGKLQADMKALSAQNAQLAAQLADLKKQQSAFPLAQPVSSDVATLTATLQSVESRLAALEASGTHVTP